MEKLRPEQLREKANMLPLLPGVYIMLDEHGEVIYIGKAKALKNRVTSYFRGAPAEGGGHGRARCGFQCHCRAVRV